MAPCPEIKSTAKVTKIKRAMSITMCCEPAKNLLTGNQRNSRQETRHISALVKALKNDDPPLLQYVVMVWGLNKVQARTVKNQAKSTMDIPR